MGDPATQYPRIIGRYAIYDDIASGGMATVHLGRLVGPVGFSRTVAIKRLHPQFAKDPEFVSMFLDEARLAARIQHPNVVPTLDVVATGGELFLVMEYVRGESLGQLVGCAAKLGERVPSRIAASIVSGALQGLHAAHEAKDESNTPLGLVHRDISPQNVLVGVDGTARVLDFGVAKAENKMHITRDGQLKGKLLYMSPEQLEDDNVGRTTDIYAMGLCLFETLAGERMFSGSKDGKAIAKIMRNEIRVPSSVVPDLAPFDDIVRRAAALHPADRYQTAKEMAQAIERVAGVASPAEVADWVERVAGTRIHERTLRVAEIESASQLERTDVQNALATELARSANEAQIPHGFTVAPADGSQPSVSHVASRQLPVPEVPPPSKPAWVLPALIGSSVLAVIVLVVVAFFIGRQRDAAVAPPVSSLVVATTPASPPTIVAAPPQTTKVETPPPSASVVATTKPVATPVKPHPTGANCNPAYTLDAKGRMHFKPECL